MSTYESLDAYTADVERARNAHAMDLAAAEGMCAACQTRKRDGRHRRCRTCRRGGKERP